MPWWDKRYPVAPADNEVFDDGGTGLFDACTERFTKLGWTVECDVHHAVWVKGKDAAYSVGIAPWMFERYPLETLLDKTEAKMKAAEERISSAPAK